MLAVAALICGAGGITASAVPASSAASAGGGADVAAHLLVARRPLPAGKNPSEIAKMVCAREARKDLALALGVKPLRVTTPTWVGHTYSCRYVYPNGSFTLSVKELSSWPQTYAYFRGLGSHLGRTEKLNALGQGAFATTDGSVVVRKDFKVLLVDIARLPAQFGRPPDPPADIAVTIADTILSCWSGD